MLTIHQKRFSFLKNTLISFFTNGAKRPGVNRPVRNMVLERIVPGGTGFGANRPVTVIKIILDFLSIFAQNIDCGYTIEPPSKYTQSMLYLAKIKKEKRNVDTLANLKLLITETSPYKSDP